jgi:hypothetical protein
MYLHIYQCIYLLIYLCIDERNPYVSSVVT